MLNLLSFFVERRKSGSTNLLNKIAKENDVYVLVHDLNMKESFDKENHNKIYTPETLQKIGAAEKKPILIDNALFHQILTDSLLEIGSKDEIIKHQENTLNLISEVIKESKQINPHKGERIKFQKPNNIIKF